MIGGCHNHCKIHFVDNFVNNKTIILLNPRNFMYHISIAFPECSLLPVSDRGERNLVPRVSGGQERDPGNEVGVSESSGNVALKLESCSTSSNSQHSN